MVNDPLNLYLTGLYGIFGFLLVIFSVISLKDQIPMNVWIGFRFKAAFVSEENWYAINRYGGKVTLPVAIIYTICCLFIPFIELKENSVSYWIILFSPLIVLLPITLLCYRFSQSLTIKNM